MPSIRERSVAPPKRLIVRIAIAIGFVMAVFLYAAHMTARDKARDESGQHILSLLKKGDAPRALEEAVSTKRSYGSSAELSRATWAALMAGGGKHGRMALLRRSFAFASRDPRFSLMFSKDSRFLAALDGSSITVWNVENGRRVLTAEAGDRFVGYWRIEAHHFGLLASYQFYDLVNDVIALPDGYRYAQPAKDSLTGVAPGGDWAYRVPDNAAGRTDYPIKLINLHTGEKREVDVDYGGIGPVAINHDATRIAAERTYGDSRTGGIWDARERNRRAILPGGAQNYYLSRALDAVAFVRDMPGPSLTFYEMGNGTELFHIPAAAKIRAVADDVKGLWFATAVSNKIQLYRGMNSPLLSRIAEKEVSPAPATSH